MFELAYYNDDDPKRELIMLGTVSHNLETSKWEGRNLQKHPAFTYKTLVVVDLSTGRGYSL